MPLRHRLIVLLILPVLLAGLAGCGGPSTPEDEIRERIREGELAAEAGERFTLAGMISSDYADAGGQKAEQMRKLVVGLLTRYRNVQLLARVRSVTMTSDSEGTAVVLIGILSQQDGDDLPLPLIRAELYRVEMTWRDEATGWNLVNAQWEHAAPADLIE